MECREAVVIAAELAGPGNGGVPLAPERVELVRELGHVRAVRTSCFLERTTPGVELLLQLVPFGQKAVTLAAGRVAVLPGFITLLSRLVALLRQRGGLIVQVPDLGLQTFQVACELLSLLLELISPRGMLLAKVTLLGLMTVTLLSEPAFGLVGQVFPLLIPIRLPGLVLGLPTRAGRRMLRDGVGETLLARFAVGLMRLGFLANPLALTDRGLVRGGKRLMLQFNLRQPVDVGLVHRQVGAEAIHLGAEPVTLVAGLVTLGLDGAEIGQPTLIRLGLGTTRGELIPEPVTLGAGLVTLGLDGAEIGQPTLMRLDLGARAQRAPPEAGHTRRGPRHARPRRCRGRPTDLDTRRLRCEAH